MSVRAFLMSGVLAAGVLTCGLASAQGGNQGRTWAEVGRLPDFTTGIWETPLTPAAFAPGPPPQLTPAYAARLKTYDDARKAGNEQDNPSANCVPPGLPGVMNQPYPKLTAEEQAFMDNQVTKLCTINSARRPREIRSARSTFLPPFLRVIRARPGSSATMTGM